MIAAHIQRVFAYGAPVDMRKGFEGLYTLVKESCISSPHPTLTSPDLCSGTDRRDQRAEATSSGIKGSPVSRRRAVVAFA